MKTLYSPRNQSGSALALTLIMTVIALAILASAMKWSSHSARMTHRSIQYTRSIAAAEAATEKVVSQITRDYLNGGEILIQANLGNYRTSIPNTSDSPYWGQWEFTDPATSAGRNYVERGLASNYVVLNSIFANLRGYVTTYSVVAHARDTASPESVIGGVLQEVRLARIPIFQFAMYSSGDMEISCGQPFNVTGQVHANKRLYVEPDNALTFQSDVTAVTGIVFARHPLDTRGAPSGSVVYNLTPDPDVAAMNLPIGTTNTPEAVREIIQPAPTGESPTSPLGRLRYHNLADLIITVSNSSVTATSGRFNNFSTLIPTNEVATFVTTNNSFRDARESGKTVRPIDINIGALQAWSTNNASLLPALGSNVFTSVYVLDRRTLPGTELGAVRVRNGRRLPVRGLTVATARPLYVQGHYNQTNSANLGMNNTQGTKPASLVADAITVLSENWSDSNSTSPVGSRNALPTTINAAFLTGVVETTLGRYSGGMENFPRFLETWGSANAFTYNGSMVKMFPSLYATNAWGTSGIYSPPRRNWAFDTNFYDPSRLPPLTPCLVTVGRGEWATVAANSNTP